MFMKKKKEPTAAEIWSDVARDFVKLRSRMKRPEGRECLSSFRKGLGDVTKEFRGLCESGKKLFGEKP